MSYISTHTTTHTAPTHVCITVVGLGGVFGAAVEETIGGRFCHPIGEMVNFHIHIATEEKDKQSVCVSLAPPSSRSAHFLLRIRLEMRPVFRITETNF